jgi:hypothetical protein
MAKSKKRTAYGKDTRQVFSTKIPDLKIAEIKTTSETIHPIDVVAPIELWLDFEKQARMATDNANFKETILQHQLAGSLSASHITKEHYVCSDENDVQGRFNENVSKVMTAIYQSEGIHCEFSSGRSTKTDCAGVPDIVLTEVHNTRALLVGEFKTPWIHDLINIIEDPSTRRRWLGMLVNHIYDQTLIYFFGCRPDWYVHVSCWRSVWLSFDI